MFFINCFKSIHINQGKFEHSQLSKSFVQNYPTMLFSCTLCCHFALICKLILELSTPCSIFFLLSWGRGSAVYFRSKLVPWSFISRIWNYMNSHVCWSISLIRYPVQAGDAIWMAPFVPQWYDVSFADTLQTSIWTSTHLCSSYSIIFSNIQVRGPRQNSIKIFAVQGCEQESPVKTKNYLTDYG